MNRLTIKDIENVLKEIHKETLKEKFHFKRFFIPLEEFNRLYKFK